MELCVTLRLADRCGGEKLVKSAFVASRQIDLLKEMQTDVSGGVFVFADEVAGVILGNGTYPRAEFLAVGELVEVEPRRNEGILRRILCGEGVARDLVGGALDSLFVADYELLKGAFISEEGHIDQHVVAVFLVIFHLHYLSGCLFIYKTRDLRKRLGCSKFFGEKF